MDEFVSDIETDFPMSVVTGNLGDDHNIEFRLGYLIQTEQVVLMGVALIEGASFLPAYDGVFDLRFGIRLQYIGKPWNMTAMDFTQGTKRRYIHPNHRETVRNLTSQAIVGLVREVQPRVITMSSYDVELPPPALVKYGVIAECLNGVGYGTVSEYRCAKGHDRWHFAAAT
ncbi:hypothetical protein PUR29_09305 [Methylobacterium ajmalii]|uniref:Uncharacterized protein n=1 Tax=Methylobacterium ajmalii TaxID=2738439 RepID=A0ABU9ZQI7_9HYPH